MSLKRRTKIQHSTSPKSQNQKQIDGDLRLSAQTPYNKENSTQQYLFNRMEQKIGKILMAYQKLEDEGKRKDEVIKELQKENSSLKQRLVELTTQKANFQPRTYSKRQPFQQHVLQRTFTPLDIKKQIKLPHHKLNFKPMEVSSTIVSIARQYETRGNINANRMLKESRSLENLNKITVAQAKDEMSYNITKEANDQENKIFSRRDENRRDDYQEDKSFVDVLGKLKQRIRKFDQQQQVENTSKTIEREERIIVEKIPDRLQKVKSNHNISRRQFSFMDKPQETQVQTQTLKKIWNQRDQQIKRMDELFSKIDQRIHVIQKQ